MIYCKINNHPRMKIHIKTLILWLIDEVCSSGGDGDALWYSIYFDVNEIYEFIRDELSPELKAESKYFDWDLELKENTIYWGKYQECLVITNNEEIYKNAPDWQQCLIKW